jgi:general secretion pathway protein N
MGRWTWWAVGLGAYLAFTLATFPAGTALRWFAPPGITFAGVAGTLWSGSAASCSARGFRADTLRWRVRPASLLLGRVSAAVEARIPDGFFAGNVTASPSGVRFGELRAATSIPALAGVVPLVRGVRGQASLALDTLVLENGWPVAATGEIKIAGLEAPPLVSNGSGALVPLGNYVVTFVPAPVGQLSARIVDDGGPLELNGTVSLDARRNYNIDALVEPRPGAPEMLVEGLAFITSDPDAEGRRRLNETGSL